MPIKKLSNFQQIGAETIFGFQVAILMFCLSFVGLALKFNNFNVSIAIILTLLASVMLLRNVKIEYERNIEGKIIKYLTLATFPLLLLIYIPPFSWDEVAYSAALPKDYALAKHFFYQSSYGPWSAFPQNFETLSTISIIYFSNLSLSKVTNYLIVIFIGLASARILNIFKVNKRITVLVSVATTLSPIIIEAASLVKNDLIVSFFEIISLIMLLNYEKKLMDINLLLLGVFVGIFIGIKYNALFFSLAISITLLKVILYSRLEKKDKAIKIFIFIFTSVIFAMPWYIKNIYVFNNPFYPALNKIFSNNEFTSLYSEVLFQHSFGIKGLSFHNGSIVDFTKSLFKLNPILLTAGLIGMIYTFRKKTNKYELSIRVYLISIFFLLFRFDLWEPRYYISLIPIFGLYASRILENLQIFLQRKFFEILLGFIVIGTLAPLTVKATRIVYSNLTLDKGQFIAKHYGDYKVADFLNKTLLEQDRVGVANIQPFFYLDKKYYFLTFLNENGNLIEAINDDKKFVLFLKNQKINYLAVRYNLDDPNYDENSGALLINWNRQLYKRMQYLLVNRKIQLINEFDNNVYIYKLNSY